MKCLFVGMVTLVAMAVLAGCPPPIDDVELEAEQPVYVRTDEEQKVVSEVTAKRMAVLRKQATNALAGCKKIERIGTMPSLDLVLPDGARLVLVTCAEAPTRLSLLADGKPVYGKGDAAGVPSSYGQSFLAYRSDPLPAHKLTVKAIVDMGHPQVPPLSAVGRITIYYK